MKRHVFILGTSLNPAILKELQRTYDTVSLSYVTAMNNVYMFYLLYLENDNFKKKVLLIKGVKNKVLNKMRLFSLYGPFRE